MTPGVLLVHPLGEQTFRDLGIVRDHLGHDPVVVSGAGIALITLYFPLFANRFH